MEPVYKKIFASLNPSQYKALTTPTTNVLQILAGPGTGKTRVITARVAYLLCEQNLPPEDVIVTTFTKKAANEMKERLAKLLEGYTPKIDLGKLFIGTFHSICVRILRVFGRHINLDSRFKIADDTDSKQLIRRVLQSKFTSAGISDKIKVKESDIKEYQNFISACKSKALLPNEVPPNTMDHSFEDHLLVYSKYQKSLKSNNLIDFDDCLLLAYKLLKKYPRCLKNVKHVLVDEFQDTNLVQLELMYLFGVNSHDKVTVVGDPDQSIYGFRHAEANNFYRMEDHYQKKGLRVVKVQLDENYRSTENILNFAETVMRSKQKARREPKELKSNTSERIPVYFDSYPTNKEEAMRITDDIRHLTSTKRTNRYKFADIAVIIRSAFLSRVIEQEMIHSNIPYIIVHGHSFWELKEVKLMVDFLRAIASSIDWLGYSRSLEFTVPGMGAKSLERIEKEFDSQRSHGHSGNVYKILGSIVKEQKRGFTSKTREGIKHYMKMIHKARSILKDDSKNMEERLGKTFDSVVERSGMVDLVVSKKTSRGKSEDDAKNEVKQNLDELKNQLMSFTPVEETLDEQVAALGDESLNATPAKDPKDFTPVEFLTQFLDSIYLYEQTHYKQTEDNDEDEGKVTITTIHGAKGLEWPVVFVPGLADGILPSKYVLNETNTKKRKAALDEECRCFYVAVTRAKDRLYLSHFAENEGYFYGGNERKPLSSLIRGEPMKLVKKRDHKPLERYGRGFASFNKTAKDFAKYRSRNAQDVKHAYDEFSHIPMAAPIVFTTARKKLHEDKLWKIKKESSKLRKKRNCEELNPVTGAPLHGKKKNKKKRLGFSGPMKPFPL